ncbi:crossover junction endodeoxyribonuclease RuvC [Candidatus Uhrbacteria bacterium]|nr:crossover junction endodeoxyribonuclease RuvC [Candidatus Uhrbacteria bacterium]
MTKKIILGIDPGFGRLGYGIISHEKNTFSCIEYGCIETAKTLPFAERLLAIYNTLTEIVQTKRPDCIAIEKIYFAKNQTTGIDVSQARGIVLLVAAQHSLSIAEYTPLQIKQALVGYGRAEKKQLQYMTRVLLHLDKNPKPDDAADALAIALCATSALYPQP